MKSCIPVISGFLIMVVNLIAGCAGSMSGQGNGVSGWPVGTTVTYVMESEQTVTAVIPIGETTTTITESMTIAVEAVGPGLFELTIIETTRESDPPEQGQDEMRESHTPVGLQSLVSLDDRGLILEATGLEDNPAVSDNGGRQVIIEGFQRFFPCLPDVHLHPGVEWTRDYSYAQTDTDFPLNFHHIESYRCSEETQVEGVQAFLITMTTRMELGGASEKGARSISLSGEGQGVIHVAGDTGMLLNFESAVTLGGLFWVRDQEMPVNQTIITTIRRKPLPAVAR